MKTNFLLLASLTLLTCLFSCNESTDSVSAKQPYRRDVVGIDVSHHQGIVDWKSVAESGKVKFVYIKATEGSTFVDNMYSKNERQARGNGILVGGYHFFSEASSPENQFKNFKSICSKQNIDLIPMIDIEPRGKLPADRVKKIQISVKKLADLMEKHYGKKPLLYCSVDVYNICLKDIFDESYPVCIGHPYDFPPVLKGNKHYDIWQFTYSGKINGVKGTFDMHRFHKDRDINLIKL